MVVSEAALAISVEVNNMEDTLAKVAKTFRRSVKLLVVCDDDDVDVSIFEFVDDDGVNPSTTEDQAMVAKKAIVYLSLMLRSKVFVGL